MKGCGFTSGCHKQAGLSALRPQGQTREVDRGYTSLRVGVESGGTECKGHRFRADDPHTEVCITGRHYNAPVVVVEHHYRLGR